MSDYGDMCRELRESRAEARRLYGRPCPECLRLLPKAHPSILLPQQRCRIHGYRDPRQRLSDGQFMFAADAAMKEQAP